jgi:hypothetical protein
MGARVVGGELQDGCCYTRLVGIELKAISGSGPSRPGEA